MSEGFTEVRILDNFYQTSSFIPMPVVLISTFAESGRINLGPYSLCFPHIVAGEGERSMMLIARGTATRLQTSSGPRFVPSIISRITKSTWRTVSP